jgi:hypothetical protein
MKSKLQRVVPFLAIVTGGLAMLAPSASATGHTSQSDPGKSRRSSDRPTRGTTRCGQALSQASCRPCSDRRILAIPPV